ncbi:acetoin utilization protein AcuC [Oceanitalea stevensii]|uniref:Acetoin utilization protein AcuC n=1 Tax=Oceanitalea stevensii TaxID=2763072 RepID=A0ABR8Z085_9MICO|nr:acetoin utilization protein AcuC [Oceanitalea stevensii]MBD8061720.1 acetoin utilization protein AcuC [Oceanitalea stevensii]
MPKPLLPWSEDLLEYNFGAGHPMAPLRLALTHRLLADLDLLDAFTVTDVAPADDAALLRVHEAAYLAAVRAAGEGQPDPARGLGETDNPIFGQIHAAGAGGAGATRAAASAVWEGRASRALSLAGGMHHAMPNRASGFCVYNDVAVAVAALLEAGAERVAYVDLDAHHGDGVERAFWDDDRVLTISVHQHPGTLFPGTGYAQDLGGPAARGSAVNVPLPPGTGDAGWLRVLDAVVAPLVEEFRPQLLVTQHGCDSHGLDPLAELAVSVDAQRRAALLMAQLADAHAGGRWVATGGGGYEVVSVVPRVWAHLAAVVAGRPLDPSTAVPESWRADVTGLADVEPPERMTDDVDAAYRPWSAGYNPDDAVDRAVMATRGAVFPLHGLDPHLT